MKGMFLNQSLVSSFQKYFRPPGSNDSHAQMQAKIEAMSASIKTLQVDKFMNTINSISHCEYFISSLTGRHLDIPGPDADCSAGVHSVLAQ